MIADCKRTGDIAAGMGLAAYMLDPAAKSNKADDIGHASYKNEKPERILLVATDHALPVFKDMDPKVAAQQFLHSVEQWNQQHRIGQKQPKNMWEQMVVAFSPEDGKKITPRKAITITRQALKEVAPGKRPTLFAVHGDTEHMHVHVMYATVNDQGKIHNRHSDFRLWEAAMEKLEIEHGLFRVTKRKACADNSPDRMPDGTNPNKLSATQDELTSY